MASSLKKLTGMGGDVRKIAALLQAKAPKGHKLAYINDEEAALLKSRGGSGKPHADTGIPSYELDDSFALQGGDTQPVTDAPAATPQTYGSTSGDAYSSAPVQLGDTYGSGQNTIASPISGSAGTDRQMSSFPQPIAPTTTPDAARLQEAGGKQLAELTGAPKTEDQSLADRLSSSTGLSKDTLAKLGLAGAVGALGARQAKKAGDTGQAGAQQMQQLAAPYQQAGAQMQAQAQRGELTAAGQQQLQAIQAQAAQGAEKRGGVGAAQVQQQVEAFRQQLLAQQYDYGLKLSGIGDNIALGAIKTGLQADQYVNQLTNNYYTNIARTLYGSAPQVAGTTAGATNG